MIKNKKILNRKIMFLVGYGIIKSFMYIHVVFFLFLFFNIINMFLRGRFFFKKTTIFSCFVIFIVEISPIPRFMISHLEKLIPVEKNLPNDIEGFIVLGGSFSLNETRSGKNVIYNFSGTRLFEWMPLLKKYPDAKIIFTGSQDESKIAKNLFSSFPFLRNQFIFDSDSKNTKDNAKNTLKFSKNKKWVLITSAFHMPRAYKLFKQYGHNVVPYPVNYFTNDLSLQFRWLSFLDNLNALAWRVSVKEYAGLFELWLNDPK
jgi:uncharacterized SAM-binding protein YcdF (DUF218 family)